MKYIGVFIALGLFGCKSPAELFIAGDYLGAISKSKRQILKNKEIEENKIVIQKATQKLIDIELNSNKAPLASNDVDNWITVQSNYYNLLKKIGKNNKNLDGILKGQYDFLCEEKTNVDYKINDFLYDKGMSLLERHYDEGPKKLARDAYFVFKKSKKNGGENILPHLNNRMNECIERGTVYYVSNENIWNNLFIKPLPFDSALVPDCEAFIDRGNFYIDEDESVSVQEYTKQIIVGYESETDTAGIVTNIPIYEEIEGEVKRTLVTITISSTTQIIVNRLTDDCNLKSDSFREEVSGSYELIEFSGDRKAIPGNIQEASSPPAFFESNLEDELHSDINSRLNNW